MTEHSAMLLLSYLPVWLMVDVLLFGLCSAQNTTSTTNSTSSAVPVVTASYTASATPLASGSVLRIQPLGDSITYGIDSTSGNGYRLTLETLLESAGNIVSYAGSLKSGNMSDPYNEGHSGAVISQITDYAPRSLPWNPNVVLLMAGTNDINGPVDPDTAPDRLKSLISLLFSSVEDVTVLVALIPPINNSTSQARALTFNAAILPIVNNFEQDGNKILAVNMSSFLMVADLKDSLHPTDEGYDKMASAWYAGLREADAKGWITAPIAPDANAGNATSTADSSAAAGTGKAKRQKSGVERGLADRMGKILIAAGTAAGVLYWT